MVVSNFILLWCAYHNKRTQHFIHVNADAPSGNVVGSNRIVEIREARARYVG
jgi:hypothetical protein